MKFGCVVFELCERTDRQTDRQTHSSQCFAPFPGREGSKNQTGGSHITITAAAASAVGRRRPDIAQCVRRKASDINSNYHITGSVPFRSVHVRSASKLRRPVDCSHADKPFIEPGSCFATAVALRPVQCVFFPASADTTKTPR